VVDYAGGDHYTGFFKDGKRSGQGSMIFKQMNEVLNEYQNANFKGEWRHNQRNG